MIHVSRLRTPRLLASSCRTSSSFHWVSRDSARNSENPNPHDDAIRVVSWNILGTNLFMK